MKAAIYTRVSTSQQVDGVSLQLQRERLLAYAASQGWEVVAEYEDAGLSGGSTDRPDYQRMMEDAKARRFGVILVYKLDRLTRSVRDFHELADLLDSYGIGLVAVTQNIDTSSPTGRLLRNILVDFANFERELIAERSMDAKRRQAAEGKYLGWRPPLGYRKVGERGNARLEVVPHEADIVRRIFALYLTGEYGVPLVARELGLKANLVRETLVNPTYTGRIAFGKRTAKGLSPTTMDDWIIAEGEHEPIISVEDFERAQKIRVQNRRRRGPSQGSPHLFSGMVHCARCGRVCRLASSRTTKRGREYLYQYYRCDDREEADHDCEQRPIRHDGLEILFVEALGRLMRNKAVWKRVERAVAEGAHPPDHSDHHLEALRRQRADVVRRIDNLVNALADGELADSIRPRLTELERENKRLEDAIASAEREASEAALQTPEMTRGIISRVAENWDQMTVQEKREGIRILVDRFVVRDRDVTIHWTDRHLPPSKAELIAPYKVV